MKKLSSTEEHGIYECIYILRSLENYNCSNRKVGIFSDIQLTFIQITSNK